MTNIHKLWSDHDIFKISFNSLQKKYTFNNINCHSTINLFIDSFSIINKNGIKKEGAVYGEIKKKKTTKISFIADINKKIYGISFHDGSTHDLKTINHSLDFFKKNISYRKINLTGDKGYISQAKKNELINEKIIFITPSRKNMKKRNNKREKKHLSKRYTIENTIQTIKKYNRISLRRDKLMVTLKSYTFLGAIISFKY